MQKPFKYTVAGYGVFSCTNGGVINRTFGGTGTGVFGPDVKDSGKSYLQEKMDLNFMKLSGSVSNAFTKSKSENFHLLFKNNTFVFNL
ncbi:MAG: hypothetical protein KL787_04625 [Taibaiella sp.]|nr:hypothetical protein [Taibaiella sp.]